MLLGFSLCFAFFLQDEPKVQHFTIACGESVFFSPNTHWVRLCVYSLYLCVCMFGMLEPSLFAHYNSKTVENTNNCRIRSQCSSCPINSNLVLIDSM